MRCGEVRCGVVRCGEVGRERCGVVSPCGVKKMEVVAVLSCSVQLFPLS